MRLRSMVVFLCALIVAFTTGTLVQREVTNKYQADLDADLKNYGQTMESLIDTFQRETVSSALIAGYFNGDVAKIRDFRKEQPPVFPPNAVAVVRADDKGHLSFVDSQATSGLDGTKPEQNKPVEANLVASMTSGNLKPTVLAISKNSSSAIVRGKLDGNKQHMLFLTAAHSAKTGASYVAGAEFVFPTTFAPNADDTGITGEFAMYVGGAPDPNQVIISTSKDLPLQGTVATTTIGNKRTAVTLQGTGDGIRGLDRSLPWLVGFGVALLGLVTAALVEITARRRDAAVKALHDSVAAAAERERIAEGLRKRERLESVGRLAGGVAHDFNNVLAAISTTADLLTLSVKDAGALADLGEIRAASQRGAALVRQLLMFSRGGVAEVGAVEVDATIGGIEVLVDRALGSAARIEWGLRADDAAVEVSASELEQIVMNLVVNAGDATADDGVVRVMTTVVDVSRSDVTTEPVQPGRFVEIRVSDNGTGMDDETRRRAIEPFYSTKGMHGTGLGLATVYGVVQQRGGSLEIDSTVGAGTTVRVLLPLSTAKPAPVVTTPTDDSVTDRLSVLLVEDDPGVRRALSRMIESLGHVVNEVDNVPMAIELLQMGGGIDLVITDLELGQRSGREVAATARSLEPMPIPVIFISGYDSDGAGDIQASGETFLEKPFTIEQLMTAIQSKAKAPA